MTKHSQEPAELRLSEATQQQKVGIITAQWNGEVTNTLTTGAYQLLKTYNFSDDQMLQHHVPGSFELPLGVQYLCEHTSVKGIVAIGCLVQGETPHFHYIAEVVTEKLSDLNLRYHIPVSYGLLTVNNQQQALERAGGKEGNKGKEAAHAMLQMMELKGNITGKKNQAGF